MPKLRRTGLFSATMPSQVKKFIKIGMRNPYFVEVRSDHGDIFAFLNASKNSIDDSGVTVQSFHSIEQNKSIDTKVNEISELPAGLKNFYFSTANQSEKLPSLVNFLKTQKNQRIIIFFSTCASVDFHFPVFKLILDKGCHVSKLHGKIDQKKRTKIYQEFKLTLKGESEQFGINSLLLTTDLAARGIDIPEVDWIVQFDPP